MRSLVYPSLPSGKAEYVICGENEGAIKALTKIGVNVLTVKADARLPEPIRTHADVLCCHIGRGLIFTYDADIAERLREMGFDARVAESVPGNEYPRDVPLNCAVIGRFLFANTAYADKGLLAAAEKCGIEIVNIKQGYARCSIAVIDENSVITSDRGTAAAMDKKGIDVLLISPGGISLPGYDCGFIGGCCGKFAEDGIFFLGDPLTHPDGDRITEFVTSKGINIIHTDGILCDFGGIIPVFENT